MDEPVKALLDLLDLEVLEQNLFRGVSPKETWQRVFGGQVIGQALVAASRTVPEDRPCHSLHCYFLRPGDPKVPIIYEVDRIRDGKSFTTRRVIAIQHGKPIFAQSASFQVIEDGFTHQIDMPEVPGPDGLANELELRLKIVDKMPERMREHFTRPRPIEIRHIEPRQFINPEKKPPHHSHWFRAADRLPDDLALHQCVMAYMSDMTLLDTCALPHGVNFMTRGMQMASLDHAIWFHRPFRADEWLLYTQDSPAASGARGMNRGAFYTKSGEIVASVAQEGLIRMHQED